MKSRLGLLLTLSSLLISVQVQALVSGAQGSSTGTTGGVPAATSSTVWCTKSNTTCWPTAAEIGTLKAELNVSANRGLYWEGKPHPRQCGIGVNSPGEQPLYGLGKAGLSPLYEAGNTSSSNVCFLPASAPHISEACLASTRNNPRWRPGFTVFVLTKEHIQAAVKFATRHNLCVSVAGPGHDFLTRHSCPDGGVFIRTVLMKDHTFLAHHAENPSGAGAIRYGPGFTFSEAHKVAADNNRVIASGWAGTVGVIGWSVGGGHGPLSPAKGTGVDNILEVEIVTADARVLIANSTLNSDLYWALRGGGGSTWGVISAITLKAHYIPDGGFTRVLTIWSGKFTGTASTASSTHLGDLETIIQNYVTWVTAMSSKFGGLVYFDPYKREQISALENAIMEVHWNVTVVYNYQGPPDADLMAYLKNFTTVPNPNPAPGWLILNYSNWWDYMQDQSLEPITPVQWLGQSEHKVGGVPSVLVPRDSFENGKVAKLLRQTFINCLNESHSCARQEMFQDITGNLGSPQVPASHVSTSDGFRTGLIHWIGDSAPDDFAEMDSTYYSVGNHSYFGESAYSYADPAQGPSAAWPERYWGAENYHKLKQVKSRYDPGNVFGCHHCIGYEDWIAKNPSK